jgi:hypothetical protein
LITIFLVKYQVYFLKTASTTRYRLLQTKTKYDLVTKLIFMLSVFLALFEEKLNKLMDQLNLSRISGRAILYPAGYRISKKAGLSGRISGASL